MESIALFIALLCCGFIFGKRAEKKHYNSLLSREKIFKHIHITSEKLPRRMGDVHSAHLVQSSTVISVDYFKRIAAVLRNIVGGRIDSYETLLDRARREAILRLCESASTADEIINLRIEPSAISKGQSSRIGCVEVLAYGTAIYYAAQS